MSLRFTPLVVGVSTLLALPAAMAAERVQVVTSFSILADMVENVGGEHVEVSSLVGPDGDTHVYSPRPGDARALAEADLVVFNGLLLEGWMDRLLDASDYQGRLVTATDGIEALDYHPHDHGHDHGHAHEHDHAHDSGEAHDHSHEHAHDSDEAHDPSHEHDHGSDDADDHSHDEHDHAHGDQDPHAWQDMAQAEAYITNIRDGLIDADEANADDYRANAERYLEEMAELDGELRALLEDVPSSATVITGHDSFGYFANAYGVRFLSPYGLSTEVEPSGASMAGLVDVINDENVQALFHENMTNPSVIEQLAEETGLEIKGTLYADALSSDGPASTYLGMMRHNAELLHDALAHAGNAEQAHEHSHDHAHEHDHEHSH
ncbi:zinc ABC transporter substrate-binding protein [Halomonas sp. PAMB 3264]|uniref:metal ABC transporter solute-binding protein, Zn/Mn family n=1 Tax=Halomonas sp. PAMB 3264 TaxID=3075222 RepID=UPI00289ACDEF|nr:zinc ABC transporter substrate-binding protein [Halomonas sp. PAMB 3264]WNL42084.1 zinc ABC transporter substrate-binding protein [Halomonas sp. PAMB 3264]